MKTYVLIISTKFPAYHIKEGQRTDFIEKIFARRKIHTIRTNYDLWERRFKEIMKGKARLSVRIWTGKPYRSKQTEVFSFVESNGIGLEKLEHPDNFMFATIEGKKIDWDKVAINDGLDFDDFCEWFKSSQKEPMAVIHFTNFRYAT